MAIGDCLKVGRGGEVISFERAIMPKPVAAVGWAFVDWTKATSWKRVAFRSLPPVDDSVAARQRGISRSELV